MYDEMRQHAPAFHFSDGIYTPAQRCALGKQKGYRAIAVADHNTTTGVAHMRRVVQAAGAGRHGLLTGRSWQFNRASVEPVDQSMDCTEMIDIIREAGGVAVLAHPHQQTKYLPDLLRLGLGGVEACHPGIDADDEREARAFAAAHRLYTTGGTDTRACWATT